MVIGFLIICIVDGVNVVCCFRGVVVELVFFGLLVKIFLCLEKNNNVNNNFIIFN